MGNTEYPDEVPHPPGMVLGVRLPSDPTARFGTLVDHEIAALALSDPPMIAPFTGEKLTTFGPSAGLSSVGYDVTLAPEYWLARKAPEIVDVAALRETMEDGSRWAKYTGPSFVINPGEFVLLFTTEFFRMPSDVIGRLYGKSTLRRIGFISDATPLEPGWWGNLVLECNSTAPWPIRIRAGMGAGQVVFERVPRPTRDYVEAGGKYHKQTGITPAR